MKITQDYKEREHNVTAFDLRALSLLPVHQFFSLAVFSAFTSQSAAPAVAAAAMLLLICCTFLLCLSVHPSLHHPGKCLKGRAFCRFLLSKKSACYSRAESVPIDRVFLSDVGTHLHSKSSHLSCASLPMVLSSV